MTATFVKNKLILVGGLGHEIKSSVDIYDIYTGSWTSGAEAPCNFYSSTFYSVLDEKLIICKKFLATYTPCNTKTLRYNSKNDYESYVFIFFFIATCTFFINTFILYVSNLISPSAASIIPKTIYEFLYHFIASILLFAASIAVIIVIHEPYVVKRYNEFLAASICGLLNTILYIFNAIIAYITIWTE
ncbi:PREDICTED: uncharacterized protein LOC105618644 [Atta cephalotes]|uniref:MARVEL domain-containing protein n=1 Tax=Atta cephalotes TaxID=12957 RepID=A0A158NDF5_ATTCE|nr:PREDICTED: uncharacterized protein LOC105618644 [Atta cephalotes]